jgi:predicted component of type VI protein secretion system
MPAQLVALNEGPSILVDKPILLLGRHPECDIQIDSRKISRRHCCIAQVDDYLVVRDLDSTNGIRINGVRVVEGRLQPGDELTVGNHRYQVTWDDSPGRGSPHAAAVPHPVPPPAAVPARAVAALPLAVPMDGDEDALLESCDEPVALPDPGRPPARAAARPVPVPGTVRHQDPPQPQPPGEDSLVIPENIELLPSSGPFPGMPERKS